MAAHAVELLGVQVAAALDLVAVWQVAALGVHLEFNNRHRGNRRQVVRIQRLEQRLGQLGKFIVQLEPNPGREKGKSLDQPLHVRIEQRARLLIQQQSLGDFRTVAGELGAELPDEGELVFVL